MARNTNSDSCFVQCPVYFKVVAELRLISKQSDLGQYFLSRQLLSTDCRIIAFLLFAN